MVIGIDGNEANIGNRVGVNEYAFQIIWGLWKLQEKGENKHDLIVYLQNDPLPDLPKEGKNFKYKVIPGGGAWIVRKLMPYLYKEKQKPDIFFSPSHYTLPFSPIPRVCSIMDLGYLEFSGQFEKKVFWQLNLWTAMSIFVSKYIISISESTKKDIVRHYPFAQDKIYVTHLGYDKQRFNNRISPDDVRRVRNKYSIVDDYVLFIGTLKPSKNIEGLIRAFAFLTVKHPKLSLVIAGKKGWLYDSIFAEVKKLGLSEKVIFTDFLPEEDKPGLIKGAKVFVMPSFWEGFSLDPLYAMASGVPVVVSKVGSHPEVVGNAGIVVDPKDIESIAGGLAKVLTLPIAGYNKLVDAGIAQAKKFSWEACAKETLRILTNV